MRSDVLLRDLTTDDQKSLAQIANNRKIWLNLRDRFPHPYSEGDAEWYINYALTTEKELIKAITVDDNLCGVIGAISQDDVYSHVGEVGYWLGEPYWSKGIGTRALQLFIDLCRSDYGYQRLEAGVFSNNLGSIKLLRKCGFIKEGVRQSRIIKDGVTMDEHVFGLII